MNGWAGITEIELQQFLIALIGGGIAALMVWALLETFE